MTCITGVSGSGKSSLARDILYPALHRELAETGDHPGDFDGLSGDTALLRGVELVDQNPIGKSSRSNPAIYIKAWDEIRKLFAEQPYAKHNNITASHFSFNSSGGRCEVCQGEGSIKVSMQFMADITLTCEACNGKRFKDEVLEVKYRDKSVSDILDMSVDEAIAFFSEDAKECRRIIERLKTLSDVGLGYVKLGQPSSTLSGGESQRVKLASYLAREFTDKRMMFIFDEPTTGLHIHDINRLLKAFNALIAAGHTIVIVEHNMEVIKCADWVIDLGPEAGDRGGHIVFEGTPSDLEQCEASHTGRFLREHNRA
jgi:excinuclease ABC subunit A